MRKRWVSYERAPKKERRLEFEASAVEALDGRPRHTTILTAERCKVNRDTVSVLVRSNAREDLRQKLSAAEGAPILNGCLYGRQLPL